MRAKSAVQIAMISSPRVLLALPARFPIWTSPFVTPNDASGAMSLSSSQPCLLSRRTVSARCEREELWCWGSWRAVRWAGLGCCLSSVSQRLSGYPGFSVCTAGFVKAYADLCRACLFPSVCLLSSAHPQQETGKASRCPRGLWLAGWLQPVHAPPSSYCFSSSPLLKSQSERN